MACIYKNKMWENRWCPVTCFYCTGEQQNVCEYNKATNSDSIRAMSDEDFAGYLIQFRDDWDDYVTPNCKFFDTYEEALAETIKWLKQPVEDKQ